MPEKQAGGPAGVGRTAPAKPGEKRGPGQEAKQVEKRKGASVPFAKPEDRERCLLAGTRVARRRHEGQILNQSRAAGVLARGA